MSCQLSGRDNKRFAKKVGQRDKRAGELPRVIWAHNNKGGSVLYPRAGSTLNAAERQRLFATTHNPSKATYA